jgi:hypothetical protein
LLVVTISVGCVGDQQREVAGVRDVFARGGPEPANQV